MPADPPLVSVVIPTYNYGRYVGEAVESALGQTYPAVEVIVVDDGSTDDTRDRLAGYGDRIRYIYQANAGLSAARNTGIAAARGGYVALLDSDDLFHPRKLELQMAYLATHPDVAVVGTVSNTDPSRAWPAVPDRVPGRRVPVDDLVVRTRFAPSSAVVRREWFDAVGAFDPALKSVEDRDFWIRVAVRAGVAVLDAPLLWYRLHPQSMSRNPDKMVHFERVVLDKAFALSELRGRWALRRKALGLAAYSAAVMYRDAGDPGAAGRHLARSFAWWPVPFRVPDVAVPLARVRLAGRLAPRLLAGPAAAPPP